MWPPEPETGKAGNEIKGIGQRKIGIVGEKSRHEILRGQPTSVSYKSIYKHHFSTLDLFLISCVLLILLVKV